MTHRVKYQPKAISDIEKIADYTTKHWSRDQAKSYIYALRSDIGGLANFPMRYPLYEFNEHSLRRLHSGHHNVFYIVQRDTIEIVRILHERMDVEDI